MTKQIILLALVLYMGFSAAGASGPASRASLKDMGARYGFPSPSRAGDKITLKSRYTTMVFQTNSRRLLFNGILLWLNRPLVKEGDHWTLTRADVTKVIDPLLRPNQALAGVRFSTVVLDPGHGGKDTGAVGRRNVYEKKAVLDIAKRVRTKLRASGLTVQLTRERDSTLSLSARTIKAREWGADVFVSIHLNSAHNTTATGIETYALPPAGQPSTAGNNDSKFYPGNKYDQANTLLAYYVQKELLAQSKGADRGIRRARFDVLQSAPCPAILVECGFVSNKIEERKILQRTYRDRIAAGIARGILAYTSQVAAGLQSK